MTKRPKVGAVIATYNYGDYILDAIRSLENQTMPPHEIFIVDDASTDNTRQILSDYCNGFMYDGSEFDWGNDKKIILYTNKTNLGPSASRNRMIKQAILHECDYIALLDADDIYQPTKIERSVNIMEKYPFVGAVYTDYVSENLTNGNKLHEHKLDFSRQNLLKDCIVNNDSVVRASVYNEIGFYDEEMRCAEDYDFWIRLSEKYMICHIADPLLTIRVTGKGATFARSNEEWQHNWNRIRAKIQQRHAAI